MNGETARLLKAAWIGVAIVAIVLFLAKKIDATLLILFLVLSFVFMGALILAEKVGSVAVLNFHAANTINTVSLRQIAISDRQVKTARYEMAKLILKIALAIVTVGGLILKRYLHSH